MRLIDQASRQGWNIDLDSEGHRLILWKDVDLSDLLRILRHIEALGNGPPLVLELQASSNFPLDPSLLSTPTDPFQTR